MSPFDALWHLLNFFAPPAFIGVCAALVARCLWRSELRGMMWRSVLGWSMAPATGAAVGGLVLTGRDGKMGTYAAMVVACAVGLWWGCFMRRRPPERAAPPPS